MTWFVIRRLLLMVPVAALAAAGVFGLIHLVPGNPALVILGQDATPQAVAALTHRLGLDRPLGDQFLTWFGNLLHGDLGRSLVYRLPVTRLILQRAGVTGEITFLSVLVALVIAVPTGIFSAVRARTTVDSASRLVALLGVTTPDFLRAMVLIYVFAYRVPLFEPTGVVPIRQGVMQNLRSLVLPSVALGVGLAAVLSRLIRSELVEVLTEDFVRTARAKGLAPAPLIWKHAFRNALLPVITAIGMQVGLLLGGVVIIEKVFAIPGMGSLLVDGIFNRDYPVVQGVVLVMAMVIIVVNLVVDCLYAVLDPRIAYK